MSLIALTWGMVGLISLVNPTPLINIVGIEAPPSGITELRSMYGGFHLGLAIFLAWSCLSKSRYQSALFASFVMIGGTACGRLYGLVVDGMPTAFNYVALVMEIVISLLSLWLLRGTSSNVNIE